MRGVSWTSQRELRGRERGGRDRSSKTLLANNHPKGAPSVSRFLSLSLLASRPIVPSFSHDLDECRYAPLDTGSEQRRGELGVVVNRPFLSLSLSLEQKQSERERLENGDEASNFHSFRFLPRASLSLPLSRKRSSSLRVCSASDSDPDSASEPTCKRPFRSRISPPLKRRRAPAEGDEEARAAAAAAAALSSASSGAAIVGDELCSPLPRSPVLPRPHQAN